MKFLVLVSLTWSIATHADARDIVGTCENAAAGEPVVELKDPQPSKFRGEFVPFEEVPKLFVDENLKRFELADHRNSGLARAGSEYLNSGTLLVPGKLDGRSALQIEPSPNAAERWVRLANSYLRDYGLKTYVVGTAEPIPEAFFAFDFSNEPYVLLKPQRWSTVFELMLKHEVETHFLMYRRFVSGEVHPDNVLAIEFKKTDPNGRSIPVTALAPRGYTEFTVEEVKAYAEQAENAKTLGPPINPAIVFKKQFIDASNEQLDIVSRALAKAQAGRLNLKISGYFFRKDVPHTFCFEIEIPDEKDATLPPLVVTVRLMDPASAPTKVENLYNKLATTVANAKARVKNYAELSGS